jgi:hypothetical protein
LAMYLLLLLACMLDCCGWYIYYIISLCTLIVVANSLLANHKTNMKITHCIFLQILA